MFGCDRTCFQPRQTSLQSLDTLSTAEIDGINFALQKIYYSFLVSALYDVKLRDSTWMQMITQKKKMNGRKTPLTLGNLLCLPRGGRRVFWNWNDYSQHQHKIVVLKTHFSTPKACQSHLLTPFSLPICCCCCIMFVAAIKWNNYLNYYPSRKVIFRAR